MKINTRERTEVRDDDEDTWDVDWKPQPRAHGRMPTTKELKARGFVSQPVSVRCWCGRPIKDSTGQCLLAHEVDR